jgi:hypothetical protein
MGPKPAVAWQRALVPARQRALVPARQPALVSQAEAVPTPLLQSEAAEVAQRKDGTAPQKGSQGGAHSQEGAAAASDLEASGEGAASGSASEAAHAR